MDKKMNMIRCYEEMIWPKIPIQLANDLIEYAKTAENIENIKNHPAKKKYFTDKCTEATFKQFAATKELEDWVWAHLPITDEYVVRLQEFKNTPACPKHKDTSRANAFNYLLTDDDAITIWFNDDGIKINEVRYKKNVWYYHESTVYHQVVEMTYRLAVTIFIPEMQNHKSPIIYD